MADFCKQCSIEIFGEDFRDLANLGPPGVVPERDHGWGAICEGCGYIVVNNEGECVCFGCEQHSVWHQLKKSTESALFCVRDYNSDDVRLWAETRPFQHTEEGLAFYVLNGAWHGLLTVNGDLTVFNGSKTEVLEKSGIAVPWVEDQYGPVEGLTLEEIKAGVKSPRQPIDDEIPF